jgi:hypothetical protein
MIRPITMICWILALSAGLYLYRAKHEVALMDRHIDQIAKDTNDLRVESRRLLDDWIRLGEPEQLRKYSDQYLGLKAVAPTQFVRLTDLAGRLPVPRADPVEAPPEAVDQGQAARSAPPPDGPVGMDEADGDVLPVPPIPPSGTASGAPSGAPSGLAGGATPASVASPAVIVVPLQARPVTPRPASGQQDQDATRQRPAVDTHVAEEPSASLVPNPPSVKVVEMKAGSMKLADTRQSAPGQSTGQNPIGPTPGGQATGGQIPGGQITGGQTPLQARGVASERVQSHELPPLQAQGLGQGVAQVVGAGSGQGQLYGSALRPAASRVADTGATDRQRDIRPMQPQSAAQSRGGSLLGMSRGGVAPLPTPTPVNANWTNSVGR